MRLPPTVDDDANVPNMRGVWDPSLDVFSTFGFLSTAGEEIVLFQWDGVSLHVDDVDYVTWGSRTDIRTSKTGVLSYVADTPIEEQQPLIGTPTNALSFQRQCLNEGAEIKTGGNGIGGHDETSEDLGATWVIADPSPGAHTVVGVGASPSPAPTAVLQSRPNPVHVGSAGTTITFSMAEATHATVKLFDLQGREVVTIADGGFTPGVHQSHWDGRLHDGTLAAPGIYLYRLETRRQSFTRRLVLLR